MVIIMRDNTQRNILNEILPTESMNELYMIRFGEYNNMAEAIEDELLFTHDNLSEFTIIDNDNTEHKYTNYQLTDTQFNKNGATGLVQVLCYIKKLSEAETLFNQLKASIEN